jgi:hypothetical protein
MIGTSMGPNVAMSPVAGSFPDANVIFSGSTSDGFLRKSSNKIEYVGSYVKSTPPFSITYTNYLTIREFPFTYGSSFTDTSASYYVSGGITYNNTIYVSSDIVGYGELKIPGATYQNVLMDKSILVQQIVSSSTVNANTERYSFYTPGISYALLNIAKSVLTDQSGSVIQTSVNISYYNGITYVSVPEQTVDNSITVYPNPATDFIMIQGDISSSEFMLFDSLGKLVKKGNVSRENAKIETIGVAAGIYSLQLNNKGEITLLKFVVQ